METIVQHGDKTVLVLGATGQQGGSVAHALNAKGWRVKALVRDVHSSKASAMSANGIDTVRGDFTDMQSINIAMAGSYGVFSVQPSSGQGVAYGVTDDDEIRYGKAVADMAAANRVHHLVYSSANAAGPNPTGVGHFDTKSVIEAHIRGLKIMHTIVRPSAFMEILMLPGMGIDKGVFTFFMRPNQYMQFIAVADIGNIVAEIFARPTKYDAQTIEIASDSVTGSELADKFSKAAGFPITYERFSDTLLEKNAFLSNLARLVDHGRLAGNADLDALKSKFPELLTIDAWLASSGSAALKAAIHAKNTDVSLR
jgi:uncharacterized protein YbjT (DUF2867 family)